MSGAPGDEAAPTALEAGSGDRVRDAGVQRADSFAKPRTQLIECGPDRDLVLDERAVQQVGVHQPHRPAGEPAGPAQQREAGLDRTEGVGGIRLGAADAQQPQLRSTAGVFDGEPGLAHEANAEIRDGGLPLVVVGVEGAHDAIAEELEIPPGSRFVDAPFFGHEIRQRRERDGRGRTQLEVRDASVVRELVGDAPLRRRCAVAPPVLVLERDTSRAELLDAAEERQRDLRKLLRFVSRGHIGRVRGHGPAIAEPRR